MSKLHEKPVLHGRDHLPSAADPIPGLPPVPTGDDLADLILATNPDAFWKLDETSGTTAHDSSGNNNDLLAGTSSPPLWGQPAGPPGTTTAKWVDNTTRVSASLATFTDNFTAGVFVNVLTVAGDPNGELIGQGRGRHVNPGWGIVVTYSGAGNPRFAVYANGHGLVANNNLAAGNWYFVAVVRDSGTWKLYIDGLLQAATITDSPGSGYGSNTWLGNDAEPGHSTYLRNALLSYGFITDSVLTSTQLLAMTEAPASGGPLDDGQVLTSDGAGGSSWQPPTIKVDGGRYHEILAGTNLASVDNADGTVTLNATGGSSDPAADTQVWMPLTTVVSSVPELVWDASNSLIPTLTPI